MRLILILLVSVFTVNVTNTFFIGSNNAHAATKKAVKNQKKKTNKSKKSVAKMPEKMTEKERKALARRQVAEAKRKQAALNKKTGVSEKIRISDHGIERSVASFDGNPGSGANYYRAQNSGADFEEIDTINVEEMMEDNSSSSDEMEFAGGRRSIYDSDQPFND